MQPTCLLQLAVSCKANVNITTTTTATTIIIITTTTTTTTTTTSTSTITRSHAPHHPDVLQPATPQQLTTHNYNRKSISNSFPHGLLLSYRCSNARPNSPSPLSTSTTTNVVCNRPSIPNHGTRDSIVA
jgi:hypothetical protein